MWYVTEQGIYDGEPFKKKRLFKEQEKAISYIEEHLKAPGVSVEPVGNAMHIVSEDEETDYTIGLKEVDNTELSLVEGIEKSTYRYDDDIFLEIERYDGIQCVYIYRFGADMKHNILRFVDEKELSDAQLLDFVMSDIENTIAQLEDIDAL